MKIFTLVSSSSFNKIKRFFFIFLLINLSSHVFSQIPAFPEAGGAGAYSQGGRGGVIIEVTNLNNSGLGSLRYACENVSGPRIVVFRVCGIIELTTAIRIVNPYLTIAGQTAPGDGITLSGRTSTENVLQITTNDVVVRFLRIRKGYNLSSPTQSGSCGSIYAGEKIIFDHCSFSWTQDENNTIWGNKSTMPRNITYSWNIVSEPLKAHPTSIITGGNDVDNITDIDYHHNLVANSSHRNPLVKTKSFRLVNNIIYNWSFYATQSGGGCNIDIIGNIYKAGPLNPGPTSSRYHEIQAYLNGTEPPGSSPTPLGEPSVYVDGNKGPSHPNPELDNWSMVYQTSGQNGAEIGQLPLQYRRTSPLPVVGVPITTYPVSQLESLLLAEVGASKRLDSIGQWVINRGSVDERIINEYNTGTGFIPVKETDVGGFPTVSCSAPYADTDKDGMADVWETNHFGNLTSAKYDDTQKTDFDEDGYPDLEEFLNASDPKISDAPVGIRDKQRPDHSTLRNYPNPFSISTTIEYKLEKPGNVSLIGYDISGRKVATLLNNETRSAGKFQYQWYSSDTNGRRLASGVYIVHFTSDFNSKTLIVSLLQ